MESEKLDKILEIVQETREGVRFLDTKVEGLEIIVDKRDGEVSNLDTKVDNLEENQNKILVKVLEMDTRMETFVTKDDLSVATERVVTTIDRFAKLHETLDQELVAMRGKCDRLEERLGVAEGKLDLSVS